MIKSYFASKPWAMWAWGGLSLLLVSVYAQVEILVMLNDWYRKFYDLLDQASEKDVSEFWVMITTFLQLAMTYMAIATFSAFLARHYAFRWRQAMTFAYIPLWSETQHEIEGSSQRLQEDTATFAAIVEDLGLELFESILKVIAFVAILWTLSENVNVPFFSDINGVLVYVALILSVGGMVISYFVGIKLPGLEYNNQKVEARFRKQLVYGEDDKKHAHQATLGELFTGLRYNYFRLFLHKSYFDLWRYFYLQTAVIVPYALVGPSLFTGAATLGVVIQTGNAFDKVLDSFSYFIRSWTTITRLLSVIKRLREFELAIGYRTSSSTASLPPVMPIVEP